MAWWIRTGITTVIAHDALNGGGDSLLNRVAPANPINIGLLSIVAQPTQFCGVAGNGGYQLPYASPINRPASGAFMALIRPVGYLPLQSSVIGGGLILLTHTGTRWQLDQAYPVASATDVWQCIGMQWSGSTYRIYLDGNWGDIARPAGSLLPATFTGLAYNQFPAEARLAAMGIWSGTVTLAHLQGIESLMRSELASGAAAGTRSIGAALAKSSNGAQGQQAGGINNLGFNHLTGTLNVYQGGSGTLSGTTTIDNVVGARQVRLYDKKTGLLVRETWSNASGAYSFINIDPTREYFAVAHDHLRVYNAVVSDMLQTTV